MMRDELLRRIAELPPDADVGIRLGDEHLDIAGLVPRTGEGPAALACDPADLRDVISAWAARAARSSTGSAGRAAQVTTIAG